MQKPDPIGFARVSYLLAIASAGIVLFSWVSGFLARLLSSPLLSAATYAIWLTVPVAAAGTFLGYAASVDLKKQADPPDEAVHHAVVGFRLNLLALGAILVIVIGGIIIRLIAGSGAP